MEFQPFPKIARLSRECFITEKIDGTNGCVSIRPNDGAFEFGIDSLCRECQLSLLPTGEAA